MSTSAEATPRRASIMRGRSPTRATPEALWRAFTDPALMPDWFAGARDVTASSDYLRVGASLSWRVSRWRFEARVIEADPPRLLRSAVATPSASSTVTHRVVADGDGFAYEKEVLAQWKGWLEGILASPIVSRSVRREAERVTRLAERETGN